MDNDMRSSHRVFQDLAHGLFSSSGLWKLTATLQALLSLWLIQATQHNPSLTLLAVVVWGGAVICMEDQLEEINPKPTTPSLVVGLILIGYASWRSTRVLDVETVSVILPLIQGAGLALLLGPIRQIGRWRDPLIALALLPLQSLATRLLPEYGLSAVTARLSQAMLLVFGENAVVSGRTVTLGERGVYIAGYCNSVDLIAQLTAIAVVFILAFPIRSRITKILFVAIAPVLAVLINSGRIAILATINSAGMDYGDAVFTFLHDEWGALAFAGIATMILGQIYLTLINRELSRHNG